MTLGDSALQTRARTCCVPGAARVEKVAPGLQSPVSLCGEAEGPQPPCWDGPSPGTQDRGKDRIVEYRDQGPQAPQHGPGEAAEGQAWLERLEAAQGMGLCGQL